ncbi:hypothetical protein [Actinokineospora iranica]|nr:hypothetical protein [Actinokineospora iranica]
MLDQVDRPLLDRPGRFREVLKEGREIRTEFRVLDMVVTGS